MTRAQDTVMPFEIKPLGVRGRVVRLGAVIDDIVQRHDYPPVVSALLAEAIALTAMLGATLKFEGKFILQTKTDGPVDMIVADFISPNGVRGYARFNRKKLEALNAPSQPELLGKGYLAMTVDQGSDMERYQGIVPLDGTTLAAAADTYFKQSEQIPTRLRLVSGPLLARGEKATHWRAGAIMVQHLPVEGEQDHRVFLRRQSGRREQVPKTTTGESQAAARHGRDTSCLIHAHYGRTLYRLYHEDGVTVFPPAPSFGIAPAHRRRAKMLLVFREDATTSLENGEIKVTCEFCSTAYRFDPETLEPLTTGSAPTTAS